MKEETKRAELALSIEDFFNLANRLVEKELFEEAVILYQTASKIFPESLAIRLNLGRVQELARKASAEKQKMLEENLAQTRDGQDVLAQQYLSLASLYFSRGQFFHAAEMLELVNFQNKNISKAHFLLGKILYDQGEPARAQDEFVRARDLDPFYEDIYKHLGTIYHETGDLQKALEAFVDAYILSGGADQARASYYRRQIRILLNEAQIPDKVSYNQLFHERKEHFANLASSLSKRKKQTINRDELDHIFLRLREMERSHQSSLEIATELRKFSLLHGLSDDEIYTIGRFTSRQPAKKDEIIFHDEDLSQAIYIIQQGSVRITKSTPYGEQPLAYLKTGEFFGEMDFIDSLRCSADAIADEETILFAIPKWKLEELFLSRKHIAVQFYWHFWKTLSLRIREANQLLKTFFTGAEFSEDRRREERSAETISVDLEKKMAILKEKGLSSKELRLLATFSGEELYKSGQNIFREGDDSDHLYIILEGQVRISKHIPGAGEEALAILERGDFFGEMALIDQAPRSADAIAHTSVTVLRIQRAMLTDLLSKDVESTYQFLYILCKMLSRRLREMNLKIYQWRMMAGGF